MSSSSIFEGVSALAQLATTIVIGLGVYVAYVQLHAWRSEHIAKRRAEIAEKLLSTALDVQLAIGNVRSAMEQVPAEAENRRDAVIRVKWERLKNYEETFSRMRDYQVLHEAFNDNQAVKSAVNELFDARQEIYAALATLSNWDLGPYPKQEHIDLKNRLETTIYGLGVAEDTVGPKVRGAIEALKVNLLSEIRMQ